MSALPRLRNKIDGWRRTRAALQELQEIGPEGRHALLRDVGISADRLSSLVARGPASAAALSRLLQVLGLDPRHLARTDRALARDMELVCSECRSSSRCARDLEAGTARSEYESYCPNATAIAALLQAPPGAAPRAAAAHGAGQESPGRTPWGFSRELDRAARAWPMAERVERQARLMGAMMERVGVNPGAAAREGRGIAFAAASRRCLACPSSKACETWLNEGGGDAPPAFCPNASFLSRARAGSEPAPPES